MVEAIEWALKRCNTNKLVLLRERRNFVFFFVFFSRFADKRVDTNTYSHSVTYSHKQWRNNAVAKVHRTESKCFFSLYPDSLIHFTYAYALPYRSNSLTHSCVAFFRFHFYFSKKFISLCMILSFQSFLREMTCTEQLYSTVQLKLNQHTQNTYSYCKKQEKKYKKKLMSFFF